MLDTILSLTFLLLLIAIVVNIAYTVIVRVEPNELDDGMHYTKKGVLTFFIIYFAIAIIGAILMVVHETITV